ncbi:MAG: sodium:proton antiporter [Erysipelotrichia bacterium]|nr:sodium:proton antiporter [Erysipelotrichia bacterium]NCC55409.1 sodium:proton antiporter [Erysipelotrichia bacterium]
MLTSIALILIVGIILGGICIRLKLPSLIGMIVAGMLLSPYMFNVLDEKILLIAADLRVIALVIILTKAGLSLDLSDLKRVGRPALLMCFVPACFEIVGVVLLAPPLLHISVLEALLMGSVLAAVSPAVIVPRMITIMEEGYGKTHSVPQLILAGASLDDIFVIVLFSSFMSLLQSNTFSYIDFLQVPISIGLGCILGIIVGVCFVWLFKKIHIRDSIKVLLILSISFLFIALQDHLTGLIRISGLVAIMMIGITIKKRYDQLAIRLANKYNKLWVGAEIVLFVLVGVSIDVKYIIQAGFLFIVVIFGALLIRVLGVATCLIKSPLTSKERLFCMGAYTPKATVQAAIATIPLSAGLACGQEILTIGVLAIILTAPLGSFFIEKSYRKLLVKG